MEWRKHNKNGNEKNDESGITTYKNECNAKPQTLLHCFLSFYPIFISDRLSQNPLSMIWYSIRSFLYTTSANKPSLDLSLLLTEFHANEIQSRPTNETKIK